MNTNFHSFMNYSAFDRLNVTSHRFFIHLINESAAYTYSNYISSTNNKTAKTRQIFHYMSYDDTNIQYSKPRYFQMN